MIGVRARFAVRRGWVRVVLVVVVLTVGVAMAVISYPIIEAASCRWGAVKDDFWYEFVPNGEVRRLPTVEGMTGSVSFSHVDVARDSGGDLAARVKLRNEGSEVVAFGVELVLLKDHHIVARAVNGTCLAPGQQQTLTLGGQEPYHADFDDARVSIHPA
jgi:hypothetical protein